MNKLIEAARIVAPNFDNLDTRRQYLVLKRFEPKIAPEDLIAYYELAYYNIGVEEVLWEKYLKYYLNY